MRSIFRDLLALITITLFVQCANPGTPTGGPKDETPPVILSYSPENNTINFDSRKIEINFDELVKFKDLKKQLVISPPMKYDPIIKPNVSAMDMVRIKIIDTLADNTTYTINFGNSLQDNNEGNVFNNFRYVFSTGSHIDSLSLNGKIGDAFKNEFPENVMVMLFAVDSSYSDSTIFNTLPTYVTNTIESDTFNIENAKPGKYLLLALKEKSRNLKFDPAQDEIAFYPEYITLPDSNKYLLKLYTQKPDFNIKRPYHSTKGKIAFRFEGDASDVDIDLINFEKSDTLKEIFYVSEYRDSAAYWFSAREADSLQFLIKSAKHSVNDTVTVTLKKQKEVENEFKQSNSNVVKTRERINIKSNFPILSFVKDSITILNLKDSTFIEFTPSIVEYKNLKLDFVPKYNSRYSVTLLPGAITNLFEAHNDTIKFAATVKKKSDYGEIFLKTINIKSYPIIVDLVTEKDIKLVERIIATESMVFEFKDVDPGKYKIRLIYDDNSNNVWDAGNFLKHEMPEEVIYFNETLDIKASWSIQQDWILKK